MPHTGPRHMTPDDFRRFGYAAVDWVARYLEDVERFPVVSRVRPGDIRAALPSSPPEAPEDFEAVLGDLDRVVLPGITHWQSPNFFAYFPANSSGPSILGELVSAGLGVQGMLWQTSPACTELETHVLDWLVELLGLPETFSSASAGGGVIQDSASSAALCALVAARERATAGAANRTGAPGRLTVYASTEAHSSIEKAVRIAGIGSDNLRKIPTDDRLAMRPDALAEAIDADARRGALPCMVVATAGTTSTMAFDPLRQIGEVCRERGLWLHVDAAMAGTAALCPELRAIHDGLELADSYCFNPHKWMLVNFDCDCFYVSDRGALVDSLSILPDYLRNPATETGEVIDYRDWQIPLGRRFRALKLWFVIRYYGAAGLRALVREHVALTRELADWIGSDPHLEIAAPPTLNLVCFRHVHGDRAGATLLERVNASGAAYLTPTTAHGRYALRLCVGQATTTRRHVEAAWELVRREAARVAAGS